MQQSTAVAFLGEPTSSQPIEQPIQQYSTVSASMINTTPFKAAVVEPVASSESALASPKLDYEAIFRSQVASLENTCANGGQVQPIWQGVQIVETYCRW